jgi:hypothetical protein
LPPRDRSPPRYERSDGLLDRPRDHPR